MACDRLEPCKRPPLDICQKRLLQTPKDVDLAPHPVVGPVLRAGDAEMFPQALGFLKPGSFFFFSESASRVHVSQPQRRMEVTRDLKSLNLLLKLMVLHRQILFSPDIAAIAEGKS